MPSKHGKRTAGKQLQPPPPPSKSVYLDTHTTRNLTELRWNSVPNALPHIMQLYWTSLTTVHGEQIKCTSRLRDPKGKRFYCSYIYSATRFVCREFPAFVDKWSPHSVYVWWILFLSIWIREQT
jgi:hypothetical protein